MSYAFAFAPRLVTILICATAAPALAGELVVDQARVPLAAGELSPTRAAPAAASMTVTNAGDTPQSITGVYSTEFARAELMTVTDGRMRSIERLEFPAGTTRTLNADGDHVMLFEPLAPVRPGDAVRIFLETADGTLVLVNATAVAAETSLETH